MEESKITIFMDRDGVINKSKRDCVLKWNQFVFMPNIFKLLRVFKDRKYRVIIITNQSVIGKGLMSVNDLLGIHARMNKRIYKEGGQIDAIYYCPHTKEDDCFCKKPKPGMFIQAKKNFPEIDFRHSFMIGDYCHDMNAASSLGIKTCFLIDKLTDLHRCRVEPDFCIADIAQAINLVPTYFENKELHKNGVGLEEYKKNYKNL